VDGTGSESYPVVGFDFSSTEHLFATEC